eukprot:262734-Pyramimonas_sp.AAC.1
MGECGIPKGNSQTRDGSARACFAERTEVPITTYEDRGVQRVERSCHAREELILLNSRVLRVEVDRRELEATSG